MCITDMIDQPVSTQRYTIYDINVLPKVVLCISVKNQYDENRLSIKSKYKPKYISHFQTVNDILQPSYYYGIELDIKDEYLSMIGNVSKDGHLQEYTKLLSLYNLTCDTCYGYYNDSTWPIDLCHLQQITVRDYSHEIDTGFIKMLKADKYEAPVYTRLTNFNILILSKSIGYDN